MMNGAGTHRDPELLVCQALELGDGGLLEDGETQQDDQSHVQRTREPPALVRVVPRQEESVRYDGIWIKKCHL